MRRHVFVFCVTAAIAGAISLGTATAARAHGFEPHCHTEANPSWTNTDLDPDVVGGSGLIYCMAGGSAWGAHWYLEVCLQKYDRADDQVWNVVCRNDVSNDFEGRKPDSTLVPAIDCPAVGYGEYRIWVHSQWFVDYWHHDWALSGFSWNCWGY